MLSGLKIAQLIGIVIAFVAVVLLATTRRRERMIRTAQGALEASQP